MSTNGKKFFRKTSGLALAIAMLSSLMVEATTLPTQELKVLADIYNGTQGGNWYNDQRGSRPWFGNFDPCTWHGLACTPPDANGVQHISKLDLSGNGLNGTLPPSVQDLTFLRDLDFSLNDKLGGSIPAVSGLLFLETLELSNTPWTGPIPDLSGLFQLRLFELVASPIAGKLPALTDLISLEVFEVMTTNITGPIPNLDTLTSLKYFFASDNQLTGSIPSLDKLTQLQSFGVTNNQLTGQIPSIQNLTNLKQFLVSINALSGPVPIPPSSLIEGALCPNQLQWPAPTPQVEQSWNQITGEQNWWNPWGRFQDLGCQFWQN